MKMKAFQFLAAAVLTLVALLAGQGAWAQTFTVTREDNEFKITRSGNHPAQKVCYRTVSLSAFGGQHYNVVSGELTFSSSETEKVKKVYVAEKTPTTVVYKYTAGATSNVYRTYRFEVLDESGFLLAYYDRDMSALKVATSALSGTFDLGNERTAAIHQEQSGILTITDGGYNNNPDGDSYANQRYLSQSSTAYYPASTQAYLSAIINAELQMTLELNAAEVNDGYQYIQLLTDNTSDCDAITENTKPKDGDPGTISASRYMAGFEIYHGDEHTSYKTYTFPVLSAGNNAGATNPWGYGDKFNLTKHKFNANCRATNGKIILK